MVTMALRLFSRRKVGCLGKLPCAPDFDLEARLGGGAEERFAGWLRAIPKPEPGAGAPGGPEAAPGEGGWAFLVLDPRGKGGLGGRLWPSSDAAGRSFPFSLHIPLGRRALLRGLPPLLHRLEEPFRAIESLACLGGRHWTVPGPAALGTALVRRSLEKARIGLGNGARLDHAAPGREVREMELGPFLEALFPEDPAGRAALALKRMRRFLRNFQGEGRPAVALRAPFSRRHREETQVAFWMEWIAASAGGPAPFPQALFLPRGAVPDRSLWLVFRDLLPQDGEVLLYGRPGHEFLFDLSAPAGDGGEEASRLLARVRGLRKAGELIELSLREDLEPQAARSMDV